MVFVSKLYNICIYFDIYFNSDKKRKCLDTSSKTWCDK